MPKNTADMRKPTISVQFINAATVVSQNPDRIGALADMVSDRAVRRRALITHSRT
ncbi:hypothetical protein [Nocardia sp. NPDC059228]|uniref:hypothetical protein n=1 Tax=Nocardia sp. NPDC059228 TaxID=3346777 RepID=UPI00369E094D